MRVRRWALTGTKSGTRASSTTMWCSLPALPIVDYYIYSIQVALCVLDPDQVIRDIIAFHANDLRLGLGEKNEDKSVGKEWMLSYCVFTILSVLYSHNILCCDKQVSVDRKSHL